jgi:hypothetical protein
MTPPMIVKLIKAGQKSKSLTSYIAGKAILMKAELGFGMVTIERKQMPLVAETLRVHHTNKRSSEARHVVLAVPKSTPRREALVLLEKVSADWIAEYAPGRPWMYGVHVDNGFWHAHLAVANTGEDRRALDIDQYDVRNMASMKFTTHAVSAKGTGMNTGLPVYSKAANLAVRDLAESLVDDDGRVHNDRWEEMVATGKITDIHVHQRTGAPTSFQYDGRHVGFKALHQFIEHEQTRRTLAAEATVPAPAVSLADLLSRFAKAAAPLPTLSVQPQPPTIH